MEAGEPTVWNSDISWITPDRSVRIVLFTEYRLCIWNTNLYTLSLCTELVKVLQLLLLPSLYTRNDYNNHDSSGTLIPFVLLWGCTHLLNPHSELANLIYVMQISHSSMVDFTITLTFQMQQLNTNSCLFSILVVKICSAHLPRNVCICHFSWDVDIIL